MSKILLSILLLTGCAVTPNIENDESIMFLRHKYLQLEYFIAHDKCFIDLNACEISKKGNCWKKHEQCVVAVNHQFMPLIKKGN